MLLTFANNRQWRHRMRARVPFFVEVREVAKQLQAKKEPTLPKLLETVLKKDRQTAEIAKRLPKGWLEKTLRSGKCILLWDGLDEVADVEERGKVAAWLDRVIESPEWRGNISLVTAAPPVIRARNSTGLRSWKCSRSRSRTPSASSASGTTRPKSSAAVTRTIKTSAVAPPTRPTHS